MARLGLDLHHVLEQGHEFLHHLVAKLARKRCDALFVNRVGVPGLGFASSTNAGMLLFAEDPHAPLESGPPRGKPALAGWMLEQLAARLWPGRPQEEQA